jgi:hypothetical protein
MAKGKKRKSKPTTSATYQAPGVLAAKVELGQQIEKLVKIEYVTDDCDISYSDLVTIQNYPREFILSFFQTEHPLIFEQKDVDKLKDVTAYCVHRIALRPEQMLELAEAIKTNVEAWKKMYPGDTEVK